MRRVRRRGRREWRWCILSWVLGRLMGERECDGYVYVFVG